jgi:serine/threonine protein kinase
MLVAKLSFRRSNMADLTTLGDYEITRKLASGGMGTVYLARNTKSGREVALKVLSAQMGQDPEYVARFQREAQATAALRHPHVVQVYDTGIVENNRFIAMEYLSGGTLQDEMKKLVIRNEEMPLAQAIQITRQIAGALDYAHKRGLIHRDIKPSNIMLAHDGRYVLTDFGIVMTQGGTKLTKQVETIGTPDYMSPEQIQGHTPDKRSDLYALGIVLYEMLTGTTPFKADNTLAILYKHVNEPPPPISQVRPELSSALQALVNKAIAKEPDKRFQTAGELIQALDRAMLGKSVDVPRSRQNKLIVALAGGMGMALLVAVSAFLVSRGLIGPISPNSLPRATPTVLPTAVVVGGPPPTALPALATATSTLVALVVSAGEPTTVPTPILADPSRIEPSATATLVPATATPLPAPTSTATPLSNEPTLAPLSTTSTEPYIQAVSEQNLVRSGPSTDYSVLGSLPISVTKKVIGKLRTADYDWWLIVFPSADSDYGWVRSDVVKFVSGNPLAVPTAAPYVWTPYKANIVLSPSDAGEIAIGANGRSNTLSVNWSVSGASLMELEITSELNGAYDCPLGNLGAVSPRDAIGRRKVLTLPSNQYNVTFNEPGYYILNFYIRRGDGGEQLVSRNVLVRCNKTFDVTPTVGLEPTSTATPIP